MNIKYYKPFTPSLRNKISIKIKNSNKLKSNYLNTSLSSFKKINIKYKKNKKYRKINFNIINYKFYKIIEKILIINILYDPNRSNLIYLGVYLNGMLKGYYVYKPMIENINIYDIVSLSSRTDLNIGNTLTLNYIPNNNIISNLECNNKCKLIRAAGTYGKIIMKTKTKIYLKLPSGEFKFFNKYNFAVLGKNSNKYNNLINKGKIENFYKKKSVRGTAKNACDHPHGGGKGKSYIGCKYSMTPWNKKALGVKTK